MDDPGEAGRPFHELRRHFFREYLDNDLLAPGGDQHGALVLAASVLLVPGVLVPGVKLFKYGFPYWTAAERDVQSWSDKGLFVTLPLIVMAALAVFNWDALRPTRRDYLALGPLPLPSRTILWAKLASLGMLLGIFAVAVTGVSPVTFPVVMLAPTGAGAAEVLRWMAAHAIASLAAAAFGFAAIAALQGILLVLLSPALFRRVGAAVQFGFTFVLAVTFLLLPLVTSLVEPLKRAGGPAMFWLPPMWFTGLYQVVGGRADADWSALARTAVAVLAGTVAVAVASHVIGYRRHERRTLEGHEGGVRNGRVLGALTSFVARAVSGRSPAAFGCFTFTIRTFVRSPRHRMVLAASLGTGCALAAVGLASSMWRWHEGWGAPDVATVLSVQLLLVFCLAFGARVAAAIPAHLDANWVFRLLDPGRPDTWLRGFRRAVLAAGMVPLLLAQVPVVGLLIGWAGAWRHLALGLVLAAVILEVQLLGFRKVPFACSFVPGTGSPKARWAFYWFGFTLFSYGLAALEAAALDSPVGFAWLFGVSLAWLGGVVLYRSRRLAEGFGLQFDDEAEWTVQTLDLTA